MRRLATAVAVICLLAPWAGAGCTGIIYLGEDGAVEADGGVDGQTVGQDAVTSGPCQGVTCGEFGSCVEVGGAPGCDCDPGYHAEGLMCVEDEPPDPCDSVVCGANATCDQGVCLCDQGYEGDPVAGCTAVSTEEDLARAELVSIAMAELGYCEGVDARPYMEYQPQLWCYDFVAWVYQQSSWSLPSPLSLPKYYATSLPAGWRPEPGDLIKFNIQHYGMVAQVSPDGQVVTTVEGNVNYCVMQRTTTDSSVEYYGSLSGVFVP